MKYRLLIATFVLSIFAQSTLAATAFNDVNSNTLYSDSIYWTVNQGITSGYGDGNWGPDVCVRRAELLKMMVQYKLGNDFDTAANQLVGDDGFSDVRPSDWFYDYVRYAKDLNIVEGYQDGTFRPNNCVNRVEAMKVGVKTMAPDEAVSENSPMYYDDKVIVDMEGSAWYAPYAKFLFQNRLVGSDHTQLVNYKDRLIKFLPEGEMSRKEVAYMIHQVDKYLEYNKKKNPVPPVESWYEWTDNNLSFKIPAGYFVHKDGDYLFMDNQSQFVEGDGDIAYLTVKNTTLANEMNQYEKDLGEMAISGRRFHVMESKSAMTGLMDRYYLLETQEGIVVYKMNQASYTEPLRNGIIGSLVISQGKLQTINALPKNTDYFTVGTSAPAETISLHKDILSLEVSYQGGCEDHNFTLYWTEKPLSTNENNVSSIELYLAHDNNGEACKSNITDRLDFDISPIKDKLNTTAYLRVYGGGNGGVSLTEKYEA